jgi:hypothetical protein
MRVLAFCLDAAAVAVSGLLFLVVLYYVKSAL